MDWLLYTINLVPIVVEMWVEYRWSIFFRAVGCWLLNHVIYLNLRRKYRTKIIGFTSTLWLGNISKYHIHMDQRYAPAPLPYSATRSQSATPSNSVKSYRINKIQCPSLTVVKPDICSILAIVIFFFYAWDKSRDLTANSQLLEQIQTSLLWAAKLPIWPLSEMLRFCRIKEGSFSSS